MLFIFVGNIAIKPVANSIIQRIGFKNTILCSLFLIFITTLMIGTLTEQMNQIYILAVLTFSGIGRSLALTAYNGMSLVEIPYDERNSANTLGDVNQNLSQGIGVSLVTISFSILNQYQPDLESYRLTYFLLGIIIIVPIYQTATSYTNDLDNKTIEVLATVVVKTSGTGQKAITQTVLLHGWFDTNIQKLTVIKINQIQ
ncbi:MAG: MFS transporter [Lactobacillaceae bacterium]